MNIIIVGAGLSGLVAAQTLTQNGHNVKIIEKGRGVGGRMASKTIGLARFDYGTQYFSAKTPDFQQFVKKLVALDIIKSWQIEGLEYERYIGTGGMSGIAKYLAKDIDLHNAEKVISIENQQEKALLKTDLGNHYVADVLVLTSPLPQSLELLATGNIPLTTDVTEKLKNIEYDPCLAMMIQPKTKLEIGKFGGLITDNADISWVADNQTKGISDVPSITVHASAKFSKLHLNDDVEVAGNLLIQSVLGLLPDLQIESYKLHRWRYSLAAVRQEASFLTSNLGFPIYFGGDAFGIGNIEGAFLSGLAIGNDI